MNVHRNKYTRLFFFLPPLHNINLYYSYSEFLFRRWKWDMQDFRKNNLKLRISLKYWLIFKMLPPSPSPKNVKLYCMIFLNNSCSLVCILKKKKYMLREVNQCFAWIFRLMPDLKQRFARYSVWLGTCKHEIQEV